MPRSTIFGFQMNRAAFGDGMVFCQLRVAGCLPGWRQRVAAAAVAVGADGVEGEDGEAALRVFGGGVHGVTSRLVRSSLRGVSLASQFRSGTARKRHAQLEDRTLRGAQRRVGTPARRSWP